MRLPLDITFALCILGVFGFVQLFVFCFGMHWGWALIHISILLHIALWMLLPLSVVVLCIKLLFGSKMEYARWRAGMIMILVAAAMGFYFGGFRMCSRTSDWTNRAYISSKIPLAELQKWSMEICSKGVPASAKNPTALQIYDGATKRFSLEVPKGVQDLAPHLGSIHLSERDGNEKCIEIWFGGGFHHWGVCIGSPTFSPNSQSGRVFFRWRDGIYGFQGP